MSTQEPTTLSQKLPVWWSPIVLGIISAILGAIALYFSPSLRVGIIIASILWLVAGGAGLFSFFMGSSGEKTNWIIATVILIILGTGMLIGNTSIQRAYAKAEIQRGAYASAINDLEALGDAPPYSQDLAKAYYDLATAEIKANNFKSGINHLKYVAKKFPTLPVATQATDKLPDTYLAWARYAKGQNDPITAGDQYAILITEYPNDDATASAKNEAPTVLLARGDALLKNNYYDTAYASYKLILDNFSSSPAATQARTQAAQALLTWAQKLYEARRYVESATEYQELIKNFPETEQGKQAQQILSQGVNVTGRLFKSDGKTPVVGYTTVRISSKWEQVEGSYTASGTQVYANTDDKGYFVIPNVPAGQYLLEWRTTLGIFQTLFTDGKPAAIISVAPLQPLQLPAITTEQK
jgi:tetratricopeptide (TPR) repeat protein